MITKDNLKILPDALGFQKSGASHIKSFGAATLAVNISKEKIIYPEEQGLVVNERQTCNFSVNENFVVFECVHRLLEKGYKADHIELEPKWKLGHGASGGRADILIKDNARTPLLIIECKTPGREFDKEWRNTLQDGGQLFSYAQQIPETQFLCLYCSDLSGEEIIYQSNIVAYRDNQKYLDDNPSFKGFKEPGDAKFKHSVWRDTYKLDFTTKGIFEDNIQPYHIGKDKYTIADLHSISAADQQKKYHEFATILRQHNVSGRENAFDKLVNLFLCKLVDETENQKIEPAKQELKFYWKGVAYDSHFDLMDRIQQLYQAGMGKFLGESITYIDQSAVKNAMRFIRQNPDATQKAVWQLFLQQKFFTNNDFSFIDVHNEKLFYQNAEVLLKILQMWQDIRLTSNKGHNQFLGDMFEFFLDQGIKQSEGQYFTPMPICRFILMSLPLESLVKNSVTPPKAIDYACGAGHFLTELALQLKPLVEQHNQADMSAYHQAIYGMEKEYRLSKVAKVSAFMYGQQEINICYGDALINRHTAFSEIKNNSFDLLVANPPFSVRGFLETLPEEERNNYTLTDTIDKLDTNNSIETFFIERAKQLLKAGGVAGLILPSSILSNGGNTYVKTREILLQYFDIVAIAEFGSGTFGKTGTNTVTLFLRRKGTAPDTAEHYRERVDEWFKGCENSKRKQIIYKDAYLIDQYAAHIGLAADDYKTLLSGRPNSALLTHETFVQYRTAFDLSTEITNLKKQKGFKAKPQAEQQTELEKRFITFVQSIERDKLYHFVMGNQQPNPVLIIKRPADKKAQKRFLGYDWSSAKGDEGIKLIKDAHGHHLTPLYDETNRENVAKLNRCIADNFDNKLADIPAELGKYASKVLLVDMLDFSRVTFEKQIALTSKRRVEVQSKWPLSKLSDLVEVISGGTPDTANTSYWGGNIPWLSVADFSTVERYVSSAEKSITKEGLKSSSTKLLRVGDLIISARGTVGALAQLATAMAFNQSCYGLRSKTSMSNDYIFYALKREIQQLKVQASGSKFDAITMKTFEEVKLPIPPDAIQQQIVKECETVDAEAAAAQVEIQRANNGIALIVSRVSAPMKKLSDITSKIGSGATPRGGESSYKETGITLIRSQNIYDDSFKKKGLAFIDEEQAKLLENVAVEANDVLFNITGASVARCYVADAKYLPARVNQHVAIIRPKKDIHHKYLHRILISPQYKNRLLELAAGSLSREAITKSQLEEFKVPVPPLSDQKSLVAEVEKLEKSIAEAQAVIASAPARKQAIMQRYL